MLTKKQKQLLLFIHERMADGDIAPSFEEMKEALGLKSKSGIHRLISGLEERGYIRRLPHRARALEIVKLPEGYQEPANQQLSDNEQEMFSSLRNVPAFEPIPLYGRIAAGTPIEAIRHEGDNIDMPASLLGTGAHYALEVDGDSMVEAGINDQDIVIIKRAEQAENGAIVVALVDDAEVTLKTLRRSPDGKVILQPENCNHEPQIYEPHRVKIQGKLVSLYRKYH